MARGRSSHGLRQRPSAERKAEIKEERERLLAEEEAALAAAQRAFDAGEGEVVPTDNDDDGEPDAGRAFGKKKKKRKAEQQQQRRRRSGFLARFNPPPNSKAGRILNAMQWVKRVVMFFALLVFFFLWKYTGDDVGVAVSSVVPSQRGYPAGSYVQNEDGLWLHYRRYEGSDRPRGLVFVVHGLGEHSGLTRALLQVLKRDGWFAYGLDLQGHGLSEGMRMMVKDWHHHVRDLRNFVSSIRRKLRKDDVDVRDLPVFVVGSGMGAVVGLRLAQESSPGKIAGVVSISGAWADPPSSLPLPRFVRSLGAAFGSMFFPKLPVGEVDYLAMSDDVAVINHLMRDRFLARGAVPARLWHTFQRGRNAAIESLANTTVPFAALHGEADRYAPIEATRAVFDAIATEPLMKRMFVYQDGAHDLVLGMSGLKVVSDVSSWLVAVAATVASK